MTAFIEYKEGKVYDPKHLRPLDIELAKAGHPLALEDGNEVKHLFDSGDGYFYAISWWHDSVWTTERMRHDDAGECLRLAPLAIKEGRPLHVGDEIEVFNGYSFVKTYVQPKNVESINYFVKMRDWRFADEVTK